MIELTEKQEFDARIYAQGYLDAWQDALNLAWESYVVRHMNARTSFGFLRSHLALLRATFPHLPDLPSLEGKGRPLHTCTYCGVTESPEREMQTDHVLPTSRLPLGVFMDEPLNQVPACASCNASKGARTPSEWGITAPAILDLERRLKFFLVNHHDCWLLPPGKTIYG